MRPVTGKVEALRAAAGELLAAGYEFTTLEQVARRFEAEAVFNEHLSVVQASDVGRRRLIVFRRNTDGDEAIDPNALAADPAHE